MPFPTVSKSNYVRGILAGEIYAGGTPNRVMLTTDGVTMTLGQIVGSQITTGTTLSSPALTTPTISNLTTAGDMLYGTGSGAIARIAVSGTAFQELTMNSGATAPVWVTGVTKAMTAQGDLPYASAANTPTVLAKGTAFQELVMNSGATAPSWVSGVTKAMTAQGDIPYASAANTPTVLAAGTKGYALLTGGASANPSYGQVVRKNRLLNGSMLINQRVSLDTSVNAADNTYQTVDRWRSITNITAGSVPQYQASSAWVPGSNSSRQSALAISAGGTGKFGWFQVIEGKDCYDLRGQTVSLQFRGLINGSSITDVKCAILQWTGTEDAVSADPVTTWAGSGSGVTTYSGSWSAAGTSANLGVDATFIPVYKLEGVTLSSSLTNLAVMIWCDLATATTLNDKLAITDVQLEKGAICTEFERRPYALEEVLCRRYFEAIGGNGVYDAIAMGQWTTTTNARVVVPFQTKRTSATMTVSAGTHFETQVGAGSSTTSAMPNVAYSGARASGMDFTSTGGVANAAVLLFTNTTSARIYANAEL